MKCEWEKYNNNEPCKAMSTFRLTSGAGMIIDLCKGHTDQAARQWYDTTTWTLKDL